MPLPSSHSVAGCDPMPTTTRSASSSVPSLSTDLLDLLGSADLGDPDAAPHVYAFGAVQPRHQRTDLLAEHRRERCRLRLHQDDVDATPRRLAATSQPMNPAPTTTACRAEPASLRSFRLSSKDRSTWMPGRSGNDAIRLGTRPVAMISSS